MKLEITQHSYYTYLLNLSSFKASFKILLKNVEFLLNKVDTQFFRIVNLVSFLGKLKELFPLRFVEINASLGITQP
jgi:hypothetical protein